MRILFLSPYVPSRIRVRPFNWIRALAGLGHEVHLVCLRPPEDQWASLDDIGPSCASVEVVELTRARTLANALRALPGQAPLQLAYSTHPGAQRAAAAAARRHAVEVVHVEHLRGVAMATLVREVPIVFDAVDSIAALFRLAQASAPSRGARLMARLDLARTERFERGAAARFDRVLVASLAERDAFWSSDPSRVIALPNGVDLEAFRPRDAAADAGVPPTVIFSGKLSYHANDAAVRRLLDRIMPRVWALRPEARVVLAGKDPTPHVAALASDARVRVTGFVPDLCVELQQATLAACPLVYGVGIQNKVLEAMACGLPVVVSPEVMRPLAASAGQHLDVAGDDEAFAQAIVRLIDDRARRAALGRAARAFVEAQHDWPVLGRRLVEAYEAAVRARSASA